ncbi:MAG: ribosome small subunit-dependent GTPase A [Marinicellaceae bacterium]
MQKYRVISTQKQTALVLNTENNEQQACFFSRKHKPICGDFVNIQFNKNEYLISKILDRKNIFSRANHKGTRQNIASNVDNQIIVVAVKPEPTKDLINRYLIAAHLCQMKPIIVFNKYDIDENFFTATQNLYQELGYTTLSTSTKTGHCFKELIALMHGKTSIFVGMSGVGKSSISELILKNSLKTGEISKKTGKGSHVTSVTQLYQIPDSDGFLIDSPGVWEYGLWKMDEHEIAAGFPEIHAQLGRCKFSNCTHTHEPGCRIKTAVDNNQINELRYLSYLRIIDSMKYWD